MKICFYGNLFSTLMGSPIGGGELQIIYLAKELASIGEQVYIVELDIEEDFEYSKNLKVISFKKYVGQKSKLMKYLLLYNLLKSINADVYHCRIRGWIHIIPFLVSRSIGAKFTLSLASNLDAGNIFERYKYFYKYKRFSYFVKNGVLTEVLFPYLLKRAHIVFAQNIHQKKQLDAKNIYNKLLLNICTIIKNNPSQAQKEKDYFLIIGSLDIRKGFDMFLGLVQFYPNIKFRAIGRFRDNLIKNYLYDNLEYLGPLPHSKTISLISSAKALISTSKMEGFPNTFLDAWASGVPVISLSVNPNGLLNSKKLGLFCENNFDKLKEYVSEFDDYNFITEDLIDYVYQNHGANIIANQYLEAIAK